MFVGKDIQSRCRNLREMKDMFKEHKVLGRKRKSCTNYQRYIGNNIYKYKNV